MHRPHSSLLAFLVLLTGLLALPLACDRGESGRALSDALENRLAAYTQGSISRTDPIRLQLRATPASAPEAGKPAAAELLTFAPPIAGSLRWEDSRTLRFDPEEPLPSGQNYRAEADLRNLFPDLPPAEARFTFTFFTYEQFLSLDIDGLQAESPEAPANQVLDGAFFSSDFLAEARFEAGVSCRQEGRDLPMTWSHSADGRTHRFSVQDIQRGDEPSSVTLQWSADELGLQADGSRTIDLPPLGQFMLSRVSVAYQPEPYFIAHFSDPLEPGQDLSGLVRIDGSDAQPTFDLDGQRLRIFPTNRPIGEVVLQFQEGIRSTLGARLQAPTVYTVAVAGIKPGVRSVGQGVILPSSEGLLFPFEAMGLRAVALEVFKIYSNNLLQFFQNQSLDDQPTGLRRVGRVVHQERIELQGLPAQGRRGEWTRYALDLARLIERDPAAVYQVRIGFRPEDADYPCPQPVGRPAGAAEEPPENLMAWWFGPYGYYDGYAYDQREDPCYPAYYNSDRFIHRNLLVSDVGLLVKGKGEGPYLAVASNLTTAQPLVGATVTYYDFQQQAIASGQTDSRGMLQLDLERAPFVAVATHANEKGYLRLQDAEALPTAAFPVEGRTVQEGLKGFLYAERGVWRPGDSIFLNFILEEEAEALPPSYPIKLSLYDPRGQLQEERVIVAGTARIHPMPLHTPPDALTGNWLARVEIGGARFDKRLPIETIQPNRLAIQLELPDGVLRADRQPFSGQMQVHWLQGAPGANLRVDLEASLRPHPQAWPDHRAYTFDDPTRELPDAARQVYEGRTGPEGEATFTFRLLGDQPAPGKLQANLAMRAFEPGGSFSLARRQVTVHPFTTYVGLRVPENTYGRKELPRGEPVGLPVLTLNPEGAPVAGVELEAAIYRLDWRWWWESGQGNVSRFSASDLVQPVSEPRRLRSGADGSARWNVEVERWGRYLLRVCDTAGGHCTATIAYAGSPEADGTDLQREAAAMLMLRTDKEQYAPGEWVELRIPDSRTGRMLITLENGSRIVQHYWAEADSLETTFRFRATPAMAPNVYAHVTILQPHGQRTNDLPMRLYGIQPISVEDPDTRLNPLLTMPNAIEPRQTFQVRVAEREGKPMTYTLAIVEEGLLALTNFPTPDPHAAFYAREALGVRTWDMYDQVLGPFGGTPQRILATGGDASAELEPEAESANRFEPVVLHAGPFELEAGAEARHTFTMPNYVGRVRAMLVAVDEDGAYGSAAQQAPVEQELMVLGTLPRVLSPDESCALPVQVFVTDPAIRTVEVSVEASDQRVAWTETTRRQIRFDGPGNRVVYFPFRARAGEGVAAFRLQASASGTQASQEIELQVSNPNPIQTRTYEAVLEGGSSWSPDLVMPGSGDDRSLQLEVSQIPAMHLARRLDYLLSYPYGCLEQIVSGAMAQLFLPRLMDLTSGERRQVDDNVRAAIRSLADFQLSSGGFSYWPGQRGAQAWVSSYAGQFLLEADAAGYALPPGMKDRWLQFQQGLARGWNHQPQLDGRRNRELDQAYRLYTMALAQYPDLASMNTLREMRGLAPVARWQLASAYALAGRQEVARELVAGEDASTDPYAQPGPTFGSSLRDQAIMVEALVRLGEEERAAALLQDLAATMRQDRWLSTQTIGFVLLATYRLVGETPPDDELAFTLEMPDGENLQGGTAAPVMTLNLPTDLEGNGAFQLQNTGKAKFFATLVARGKPPVRAQPGQARNLQLSTRYLGLDGEALDPAQLMQGTDFLVEARVKHTGSLPFRYDQLALEQVFPSGWAILPAEREEGLGPAQAPYTYRDVRDDRVHTFFDLRPGEEKVFRIRLNAAYLGRFYLPPTACEAMYDPRIQARTRSGWIEVVRPPF